MLVFLDTQKYSKNEEKDIYFLNRYNCLSMSCIAELYVTKFQKIKWFISFIFLVCIYAIFNFIRYKSQINYKNDYNFHYLFHHGIITDADRYYKKMTIYYNSQYYVINSDFFNDNFGRIEKIYNLDLKQIYDCSKIKNYRINVKNQYHFMLFLKYDENAKWHEESIDIPDLKMK